MLTIFLGIASFLAFLFSLAVIFRPGGLMDNVVANRDKKLHALEENQKKMESQMAFIASEVAENASTIDSGVSQVKNRLKAVETKYGITQAKNSKEEMAQQFVAALQQIQKQRNQNNQVGSTE